MISMEFNLDDAKRVWKNDGRENAKDEIRENKPKNKKRTN